MGKFILLLLLTLTANLCFAEYAERVDFNSTISCKSTESEKSYELSENTDSKRIIKVNDEALEATCSENDTALTCEMAEKRIKIVAFSSKIATDSESLEKWNCVILKL